MSTQLHAQLPAQNVPVILSFFRTGEHANTLSFSRDVNYQETWSNLAKRYNLNRAGLLRFNRLETSQTYIQQKTVFVPLIYGVNLFTQQTGDRKYGYIPVYYLVPNRQRVSNLYLRFREPVLSFMRSYNKFSDHYILNKGAPVFVGYLRVLKSVGWNKAAARDISDYRSYEQMQEEHQESVNIAKLRSYSAPETALILGSGQIGGKDSAGGSGLQDLWQPNRKVSVDVAASLSPEATLQEINSSLVAYIKREAVLEMRKRKSIEHRRQLAVVRTKGKRLRPKEEKALASVDELLAQQKTAQVTGSSASGSSGSFFEAEYEEALARGDRVETLKKARAKLFRLLFDESNGKFYALANETEPGSTIRITNTQTKKNIYAKVISNTPQSINQKETTIVISEKGAAALGVADNQQVDIVLLQ